MRRIISGAVVLSDDFLSLSHGAQALYFALNLSADDSGFVTTVRAVMSMLGVGEEELNELEGKYLIVFREEKAALIVHWLKHNTLKKLTFAKSEHPELERRVYVDECGLFTIEYAEGRSTLAEYKGSSAIAKEDRLTLNKNNRTESNSTKHNKTEENKTDARSVSPVPNGQADMRAGGREIKKETEKETDKDDDFAEYDAMEPRVFMNENIHKELGRKLHMMNTGLDEGRNVFLSAKQVETLERLAPPEAIERYIKRLGRMIEDTGCDPKNHYRTIRKWIIEDIKP